VADQADCKRLAGRVAIVTGGSSGIGYATCVRLGQEGARVVIADRNAERGRKAVDELKAAGAPDATLAVCDVAVEDQVESAVKLAIDRFGRLDVIVNNAGLMEFKPLAELTADDWRRVLAVDLIGAAQFIRFGFGVMKPGASIVNVASVHAVQTTPDVAPYAAAKAALLSLTRSAAIEGKASGVRCNAVLPGAVDTKMLWSNPNVKSGVEKIDPKDVGRPEDIAAAIAFLASDDGAFTNGAALAVDGGRLAAL
jgi:NAD(P)-dependent dehydrogenase (short-subunit alcohol dehydrogenase family)